MMHGPKSVKLQHLSIIATDHSVSGYDNLTKIDPLVRLVVFIFTIANVTAREGLPSTMMYIFNPLIDQ